MLLKKLKIISLKISKFGLWTNDEDKELCNVPKIPLVRLSKKCGRVCELNSLCNWINYRVEGPIDHKRCKSNCNCEINVLFPDNRQFEYIFTYEILRKYIPIYVLKNLGMWKEPKISRPSKNKLYEQPQTYNKLNKYYGPNKGKYSTKNYNARKR